MRDWTSDLKHVLYKQSLFEVKGKESSSLYYLFLPILSSQFSKPYFQFNITWVTNTKPLHTNLTHVNVHLVHTHHAALPILERRGLLRGVSDLKGDKVKYYGTLGLVGDSGLKWRNSESPFHTHILLQSSTDERLTSSCDGPGKPSVGKTRSRLTLTCLPLQSSALTTRHGDSPLEMHRRVGAGSGRPRGLKSSELLGSIFVIWA